MSEVKTIYPANREKFVHELHKLQSAGFSVVATRSFDSVIPKNNCSFDFPFCATCQKGFFEMSNGNRRVRIVEPR
jgi:hypothetical protein